VATDQYSGTQNREIDVGGEMSHVVTVQRWSGREARALREAERLSVRAFAATLGVNDAAVSNWERRSDKARLRYETQQLLDIRLAKADDDTHARFKLLLAETDSAPPAAAGAVSQVRHPVDGKLITLVEAGVFLQGPDNEPAWLDAFYIDVYPTTNADYSRFIEATGHRAPAHWVDGRYPDGLDNHPVVFVTWHDAHAYATWAGKTLPTSLQWEKAARGTRGNVYPWGNQVTPAKCNVRESDIATTTPVDRYHSGVSPYGVYDMCGNAWEWCATETEPSRYQLKGSAFTSPFTRAAPSMVNDASADMCDDDTGFRCVTTTD
jgi:formylglycine-generating enzyme required for sulfatase activity